LCCCPSSCIVASALSEFVGMMTSANYKFSGSAFLQKELQGVAAFVAFQECHRRGESTTKAVFEASMAAQYFGDADDDDSIGLTEQLRLGTSLFSGLYNEGPISTTSKTNTIRTAGTTSDDGTSTSGSAHSGRSTRGEVLVLQPELHCHGEDKRITVGGAFGITMSLLSAPSLKINA
jgi:hypothetical protein